MSTTTGYVPYDYIRLCDLCGGRFNRSRLHKQGQYMYCDAHDGERTTEELDRANARHKPFRVLPVPNAKPEDQTQPDVFQSEESEIFNLIDFCRPSGARYAQVLSGDRAVLTNTFDVIPVNAWACRYYYGLATQGTRPLIWTQKATDRLRLAANTLLTYQTTTGTRATNSFYGGLLGTGATYYYAEDTMASGLALVYAYRVLRDGVYLAAARACANFLRNVQAIGSDGVNYTSSDSAGTSRLYTGGITNYVRTGAGFLSDHRFYPSSLLALQFWNELKLTDGDQAIGATAAIAGDFTTAPSRLMSACISDLRAFWEDGVYDATARAVRTGLSATTPAEFFNAYPAAKNGSAVTGTGSWEYQDGGAATGTTVTAGKFAQGISSLYAVDGLSDQVIEIDDWLQAFTSNTAYETAANTSPRSLARATTGAYDPKVAPAKYLLVRDSAASYAYVAKNASSLYDWGAFGLLAPILASRHTTAFKLARLGAATSRRRLSDGLPSDGFWDDVGFMRGRQGLTNQTYFLEALEHGSGVLA